MSRSNKPTGKNHPKTNRTAKTTRTTKTIKATKVAKPKTNTSHPKADTYAGLQPPPYIEKPQPARQAPCYIPLCLSSQSGHSHVLYYNANAPIDEIFECATARLQAVIDLMENLLEYNNAEKTALPAIATVSNYLLSDAMTLLQELDPIALALKNECPSN